MRRILLPLALVVCLAEFAQAVAAQAQKPSAAPPAQGLLDVVVVDDQGKRLSGALVAVPGYRSTTGIGGSCRFSLLPGRYAILVSKPGYRGRRVNVGVRGGVTATARVQLQKLPPGRAPRD